jgi:hypothetical protein
MNRRNLLKSLLLAPLAPLVGKNQALSATTDPDWEHRIDWYWTLTGVECVGNEVRITRERRMFRDIETDRPVDDPRQNRLADIALDYLRANDNARFVYMQKG